MAALPPSRHERRARPGSLASPVNSRMYRGTWLLVGIPLLVAAFTVYRPHPLRQPDATAPVRRRRGGAGRRGVRERLPGSNTRALRPRTTPRTGSPSSCASSGWTPKSTVFTRKSPVGARSSSKTSARSAKGRSNQIIVVVAHRDNSGASPGANDNGSGTAALIELARSFAASRVPPQPLAPNTHDPLPLHRRRRVRRAGSRALRLAVPVPRTGGRNRQPGRDRRARPAASRVRRRHAAFCIRGARANSFRAHFRASGSGAEETRCTGSAPRSRLPAEPLRAGAVRRSRDRSNHHHLGRRPASAVLRRHAGKPRRRKARQRSGRSSQALLELP